MIKKVLPAGGLLLILAACTNENKEALQPPASNCDTATVTYTAVIRPLTNAHCAISGCHVSGVAAGNINLEDYVGLKAIADDGSLLGALRGVAGYSLMPLNAPRLDDCTIAKYAQWVAQGAPNN